MSDPSLCPNKARLLDAYERAMRTYSSEVSKLREAMGTLSRDEYNAAYSKTEELRMLANEAHDRLMAHVTAHGCSSQVA